MDPIVRQTGQVDTTVHIYHNKYELLEYGLLLPLQHTRMLDGRYPAVRLTSFPQSAIRIMNRNQSDQCSMKPDTESRDILSTKCVTKRWPSAQILLLGMFIISAAGCGGGGGGGQQNIVAKPVSTTLIGKLIDRSTGNPLVGYTIQIQYTASSDVTDSHGEFSITKVPSGTHLLVISDNGNQIAIDQITIGGEATDNLGTVSVNIEGTPPPPPL